MLGRYRSFNFPHLQEAAEDLHYLFNRQYNRKSALDLDGKNLEIG